MNTHKNARLTFARRMQLVRSILDQKLDPALAAAEQGLACLRRRSGWAATWLKGMWD